MTTSHEAIAANPVTGNVDKAAQRAMFTRRFAYCLTVAESATDLVAVDPATGVIPYYLVQNNILFGYDATDTTTAHDGTTCLVTSDGKRYKSGAVDYPWSVLTQGTTAQPATPAEGDRYLIPTAATGVDWAGQDGKVGTFKSNRWQFSVVPIGRLLHIEDKTSFYHRNTSGAWTGGLGDIVIGAAGINITNMLGADASFVVKVENQTTNTPPASPIAPVAYIVGAAPAGGWSAYSPGDMAVCLVDGTFTRIVPATGDEVYDKALNIKYVWNGTTWISASGSVLDYTYHQVNAINFSTSGSSAYNYSDTTAPNTSSNSIYFSSTDILTHSAKAAGNILEFTFSARLAWTTFMAANGFSATKHAAVLLRDSETAAIDWVRIDDIVDCQISGTFLVTAPDTASHTYKFGVTVQPVDASNIRRINTIGRFKFILKEIAP